MSVGVPGNSMKNATTQFGPIVADVDGTEVLDDAELVDSVVDVDVDVDIEALVEDNVVAVTVDDEPGNETEQLLSFTSSIMSGLSPYSRSGLRLSCDF